MRGARRRGLAAVVALASLASCDQLFDIQERQALPADSGVDASVESGEASPTDTGVADTPAEGTPTCSGPTIYVSQTNGADSNPGCSDTAPKKTIGAAVEAAAESSGGVTSIEVCKGTYDENPLLLATATSLLGGYDCATWTRTTNYGYPNFDGVDEVVVQNADTMVSSVTLDLSGSALSSSVVVDGLTILGATTGTINGTAMAVLVSNGAAPTVSNDKLTGGSQTVPNFIASVGLYVATGANPTIKNDSINGGSGVVPATSNETAHASIGVFGADTAGGLQILDNVISGGSGQSGNTLADGSAGVEVLGPGSGMTDAGPAPTVTIRGNSISGGTGTAVQGAATVGLYVNGMMNLTVASNGIDGGGGSSGTHCTNGVYSATSGTAVYDGNRIWGGVCSISGTGGSPVGLKVNGGTASPVIYNNMIHSGTTTSVPSDGPSALFLSGVSGADVRHNTLVTGTTNGALGQAIQLLDGTTATTIDNNILAGSAAVDSGLVLQACADAGPPALASFQNNLVFGTPGGLLKWSLCYGGASYDTLASMTANLLATETGATVQGNVTLAPSCTTDAGTDPGCVVSAGCTSPGTCLTTFFGDWDTTADGYKNLFPPAGIFAGACPTVGPPQEGNGFTIAFMTTPPCSVTQSSLDDTNLPGLNVDLYGNCRTTTPSMGAEERSTVACAP